ncbi:T9SS type A sorting domain-containing protein [Lacinutrix sp.]|uniref:T9SS type A sorting domain-containing protein n=1 Tax=Lacinutrix sp. TaxID=1937692 RepID=UPI002613EB76|nr:T9SS type A sorting domain-containing protein [Lacinutrix sp.]MDG1714911.1 T9SS type A sorting domain-containing protein [Lacinutrix sp.]
MRKIPFLFALVMFAFGYSQTNLEDFESSPNLSGFEGLGGANVVANPSVDANNGSATVGELIVVQAGNPWQGANLVMQSNYLDVSDPVTNTVTLDVYSTSAFNILARLAGGQNGATDSAADAAHTGSGWETLTFTFNQNLDNTGSANGEYSTVALFPNWNGGGYHDPEIERTVYVDNLSGTQGAAIPVVLDMLEDFETTPIDFVGFEGLGGANVVANPSVDANNGSATAGELIVVQAGNPWQGANLVMQDNYIDVSDPTTNIVTIDAYSTTPFNILARLDGGQNGAIDSAADAAHTGSGWETLTFTFNENLDNTGSANGEYDTIALFPNWNGGGWHDPEIERTVYVDNIQGTAGAAIVVTPPAIPAAPIPDATDANVYSVYNDTNSYSTIFPFAYQFGGGLDSQVDLDPSANVNNAWKFNLGNGGYGQGEEGTTGAINAYDHVTFDYYIFAPTNSAATATGFKFVLISDNTTPVTEVTYEIGTNEAVVTEQWTKVSIPLTYFTNLGFDQAEFFQWKIDPFASSVDNNSILYIDNFLFTNGDLLSTANFTDAKFSVFPNPTNATWNVISNSVINTISVYDILGKQVISVSPNTLETSIDASNLKTGVYFARIDGVNGSKTVKLIRE